MRVPKIGYYLMQGTTLFTGVCCLWLFVIVNKLVYNANSLIVTMGGV